MAAIDYPFAPKSNRTMQPGQFWQIPLSDGRYACGRVLEIDPDSRVMFWAALLDWVGSKPPTFESIAGSKVIAEGNAHIHTIVANKGRILGLRPLQLDRIRLGKFRSQHVRSGCMLQQGYSLVRRITEPEFKRLKVASTWGYRVIVDRAERRFIGNAA